MFGVFSFQILPSPTENNIDQAKTSTIPQPGTHKGWAKSRSSSGVNALVGQVVVASFLQLGGGGGQAERHPRPFANLAEF